jgi:endonuclease/exonuclease/phosphatase family metal-dependent hydrolase
MSWVSRQARANLREILSYAGSVSGPTLIMGDLNQTPDVDLWQPLVAAGWTDIWSFVRPGAAGYTFEAAEPRVRIDYAWANQVLLPRICSIEVTGQAQATGNLHISDHMALLVTCDIRTERD